MSQHSKIEWTDATWNPVTGCTKVSRGCDNCYAYTFAERWRGIPGHPYEVGFDLTLRPNRMEDPLHWKKPRTIFVNSMSDLFHVDISDDYILQVFDVMRRAFWHRFQILTKRAERLYRLSKYINFYPNMWIGVSVESPKYYWRVKYLQGVPGAIRFLSCEPMLEALPDIPLEGIDWVIVGGESGRGARPMHADWVKDVLRQCGVNNVPFFFKQWGGVQKKNAGRTLDGKMYDELPSTDDTVLIKKLYSRKYS